MLFSLLTACAKNTAYTSGQGSRTPWPSVPVSCAEIFDPNREGQQTRGLGCLLAAIPTGTSDKRRSVYKAHEVIAAHFMDAEFDINERMTRLSLERRITVVATCIAVSDVDKTRLASDIFDAVADVDLVAGVDQCEH